MPACGTQRSVAMASPYNPRMKNPGGNEPPVSAGRGESHTFLGKGGYARDGVDSGPSRHLSCSAAVRNRLPTVMWESLRSS